MTNQDVIDMVQAKMSESTIAKAIETAEPGFDTSAKALIKCNAAKVPDDVLQAMIDAENGGAPAANGASKNATPPSPLAPGKSCSSLAVSKRPCVT